jgi:dCMP deaminase
VLILSEKWDIRFLELAELISTWSKDPSTKCGAVIVRPDRTIASVGFNGFPRGCNDDPALYEDRELKYARVIHAEQNALLNASENLQGFALYTWPPALGPTCDRCAAHVIQAGIIKVVHKLDVSDFSSRWKEQTDRGLNMYSEAGVEVIPYY